jgi:hypothetical protein
VTFGLPSSFYDFLRRNAKTWFCHNFSTYASVPYMFDNWDAYRGFGAEAEAAPRGCKVAPAVSTSWGHRLAVLNTTHPILCCSRIAEAAAAVSVNEKKWLVMHMHVQLKLDELRGPPNPWLTVTHYCVDEFCVRGATTVSTWQS